MAFSFANIKLPLVFAELTRYFKKLRKSILLDKLSQPAIFLLLLVGSIYFASEIAKSGVSIGVLILVALIGLPIAFGVIAHPKFGMIIFFIAAYMLFVPMKLNLNFPLGTSMDALMYFLILGYFIKQKNDRRWDIYKDNLSYIVLAWLGYNFFELVNPASISPLAWLYTIRSTGVIILLYFIFIYHIRDMEYVRLLFKIWLFLALLGAMNGFKQENFGYFEFEKTWLYSDPLRVELLFQDGHMRKVSIFSDPVAYAYNMVAGAVICIVFLFGTYKVWKKIIMGIMAAFFMMTMMYSGTRGAFPLVPAALLLLAILNFNRRILIFAIIAAIIFTALIVVPTSNPNIRRFQTAFVPNDDPSFNLRKKNQERIRPFIQSHPIGGGLGATGEWGSRFAPGSMLAHFPPDSGYVRVAVEMGTIGIILLCTVFFMAMYTGINYYYLIKDPEIKNYCLAMVLVIFIYNIGNFPQEAIVQYPSNVIIWLSMALINILYRLDQEKTSLIEQEKTNLIAK